MTVRAAFGASVVGYAVALVVAAFVLPDRVAMHRDATGRIDGWAGHTEAVVTMGVVGGAVALLFAALGGSASRLPISWINVPGKQWWTATEERESLLRHRLRDDLYLLGALTMGLLVGIVLLTIPLSRSGAPAGGLAEGVLVAAYLLAVLAWTGWAVTVRYRPGDPA